MGDFHVEIVDYEAALPLLRRVRETVFVLEQQVPADIEWDAHDPKSLHALALAGTEPIGTGRLLLDGHIGRMAVLEPWRGQGVGAAILEILVDQAEARGDREVVLNAQVRAVRFYAKYGFAAIAPEFIEAGIPHVEMRQALPRAQK